MTNKKKINFKDMYYTIIVSKYIMNIACILTHWFTGSSPFPPRATLEAGSLSSTGFLLIIEGSANLIRGP